MNNHRGRPPGAGAHRYPVSLPSICGRLVLLLGAQCEVADGWRHQQPQNLYFAQLQGTRLVPSPCNARAQRQGERPLAQGIGNFAQLRALIIIYQSPAICQPLVLLLPPSPPLSQEGGLCCTSSPFL